MLGLLIWIGLFILMAWNASGHLWDHDLNWVFYGDCGWMLFDLFMIAGAGYNVGKART